MSTVVIFFFHTAAKDKLPVIEKLLQIQDNQRCIIVGTLFKDMPLVPRVLDQFTKEVQYHPSSVRMIRAVYVCVYMCECVYV